MRILGIAGATHDSGIAILDDGRPELVIEEERLNREKRTNAFPRQALAAAFGLDGKGVRTVDAVVTPWDVKRIRASFIKALAGHLPYSLSLLSEATHAQQRNEIVLLNSYLRRKMQRHFPDAVLPPIINVPHHDAHAAAFFVSPFEEAHVLVMDGYGDDAATSVYRGRANHMERVWHSSFFNSIGMVYTFVTEYLGFRGVSEEGKVMALAAFGDDRYVTRFRDCITLLPEGRYAVDMSYFSFDTYGELRPLKQKFYETFGPPRKKDEPLNERFRALASALQTVTEETILHIVRHLETTGPSRNLVLAGGVALNCVANARILRDTAFERIWVPPGASDTGAPLGAALWHHHQTLKRPRRFELRSAAYGLDYSGDEIDAAISANGLNAARLTEPELLARVARDLADGKIVGWFQGRFEMGPRALGQRSILADPRDLAMRKRINEKVKYREHFRPFAPAVLEERASEFFEIAQADPFMTIAPKIRPEKAHLIQAAVHADGTGRIQTVSRDTNPRYWGVIHAFGELTGVPVVLNTSFNRQEPIVASPADAVSCFQRTAMDVLVLGDRYLVRRSTS